ncbi:MAG TPA: response regulator [Aggregatilineales bacterium]|nr:response regulator [Aggregatilineales bacterium]
MASVLVVDDDPDLRFLMEEALSTLNCQTETASNGTEGEAKALQMQPDLILLDIMMPMQDGYATCVHLRAKGYKKPILLMSAMPEETGRQKARDCLATGYVQKPITRETLQRFIDDGGHLAKLV